VTWGARIDACIYEFALDKAHTDKLAQYSVCSPSLGSRGEGSSEHIYLLFPL
jgi:hypothetical protein